MAAIDSNALDLVTFAKMSNAPRATNIAMAFLQHSAIVADIPWFARKALRLQGVRWQDNLPDVDWVKLNEAGPTVKGTPTTYMEQAFIARNMIKTDHLLIEDESAIGNPHLQQVDAYIRSRSHDFNYKFINNSHVTGDSDSIVGIRARLDDPNTYNADSSNKIGSGGTMTSAATAANFVAHQEKLDELLYRVGSPNGDNVVLYCNDVYYRRFAALSRQYSGQGGFSQAQDQYGRDVYRYKNAVLRDAGLKADQSTKVITSTETSAGVDGASTYTSVYAVNYGPMQFSGWINTMSITDPPDDDGVLKQSLVEFVAGLYPQTKFCIGRLYGINLG